MALETGTYLDDLVVTNPDGSTDKIRQGDDHLKLIKTVLKNTFPGMTGRAWRTQTKGTNYTAVANDAMSVIRCTAAITLSLTAAATIGNGYLIGVYADSGAVVIDPNGAETVNSAATLTVNDGDVALLFCDGSNWHAFQLSTSPPSESVVDTTSVTYTALAGTCILADTTSAAIAITAPASGSFAVVDAAGTFDVNNVTVTPPSGESIMGGIANEPYVLDQKYGAYRFRRRSTGNWRVSVE